MLSVKVKSAFECPASNCWGRLTPVLKGRFLVSVGDDLKKLIIWEPKPLSKEKAYLTGHEKAVTALGLSPHDGTLLCSCSADRVIVWDLSELNRTCTLTESNATGVEVGIDLGYIQSCAFSWDNKWLALAKHKELWILKFQLSSSEAGASFNVVQSVDRHGVIGTKGFCGNLCTFSSEDHDLLVLVEDNQCFKVWDVVALTLLYQSTGVGSHPITLLTFVDHKLLLCTSIGMVNMFKVRRSSALHLAKFDVGRIFQNDNHSGVANAATLSTVSTENQKDDCDEMQGCIVYSVCIFNRASAHSPFDSTEDFGHTEAAELLLRLIVLPGPVLAVCCNLGIAMYDCKTQDCLTHITLADIFAEKMSPRGFMPLVDFIVVGGQDLCDFHCISKILMGGSRVYAAALSTEVDALDLSNEIISVIPRNPVKLKSPLRCNLKSKKQPSAYGTKSGPGSTKSTRKQKSSGYGISSQMQMFVPVTTQHRQKQKASTTTRIHKPLSEIVESCSRQLMPSEPPMNPAKKIMVWNPPKTAMHLTISSNGEHIACSSNRMDISILRLPQLDIGTSLNLFGHEKQINSLHFSFNSKWMVSSSEDGTAKVWDWKHRRCALNIDNAVDSKHIKSNTTNKIHFDSVKQAKFFYMDQFLLLAEQGNLALISYLLHEELFTSGSMHEAGIWKCIKKVNMPTKQVTCFSAANQFHSYLVLCGCSSKAIKVYDLNAERLCLDMARTHKRPPYQVVQLEGSACTSHPAPMHDLFLSAAVSDGARMWDLRSARCVQKYSQHSNRCYSNGVDISPCGRYIAASSENKTVYLYDTRNSEESLGKLLGLDDVVMDVAFSPIQPLLAANALNAHVMTFCP